MKEIKLTQGQVAIVDDEDFEWLNQWKWQAKWNKNTFSFIAARGIRIEKKQQTQNMARLICGLKYGDKRQVDHKNFDTLDNRRQNLRVCTHQQNSQNCRKHRHRSGRKTSSIYTGVYWHKLSNKWQATITYNRKRIYLGCFIFRIDAALAYDKKARELCGEFACLNFPEPRDIQTLVS
jgi:hypothetical protein